MNNAYIRILMDFYQLLGVPKTASPADIKKAFHLLSLKYHPDKYNGNSPKEEIATRYQKIKTAYETLCNPEKRALYDKYGDRFEDIANQQAPGGFHPGFHGFPGVPPGFAAGASGGENDPFGDMFRNIFGNAPFTSKNGGPNGRTKAQVPQNIINEVHVTFAEAYTGTKKNVAITKKSCCETCQGKGTTSSEYIDDCDKCKGRGVYLLTRQINPFTVQQSEQTCDRCKGQGETIRAGKECQNCKGLGHTETTEMTEIPIVAGSDTNFQLMFGGQGHHMYKGNPGNLVVVVKVGPPPAKWERAQNDLKVDVQISLRDALLGFRYLFKHLDGRELVFNHNGVMPSHSVKHIPKEGFPNAKNTHINGDLYVRFIVDFSGPFNAELLNKALPPQVACAPTTEKPTVIDL